MDPVLAQIYGTNSEASDLEKLASAQMAEELGDEGVDFSGASDDDIEAMAAAVLDDIQGEQGGYESDVDDDTMAKVAEADKLGRVMAHSMWQELGHIKEAAEGAAPKPEEKGPGFFGRMAGHAKHYGKAYGTAMAGGEGAKGFKQRLLGVEGQRMKVHGARAGTAAALGLAGYGLKKAFGKKDKKKQSSALDTLAEARALEILEANGVNLQKTASPADVLSEAVDARAYELLVANGFIEG